MNLSDKELRKIIERPFLREYMSIHNAEERSGEERRVIRCGLRDYDVKCRANGIIPTAIHGADLDRRRFPDRRKAVSDNAQSAHLTPHVRR